MFQFITLVLKNLRRNRLRTGLTATAVVVLTVVYSIVGSTTVFINRLVNANANNTRLVVVNKWITPSRLPARYIEKAINVRGVEAWTIWHYYFGFLDESKRSDRYGVGIATRFDNLQKMHSDLEQLDPRALAAMQHEKTGALVGQNMLDAMKWQVGQRFTVISATHPGKNLEFKIVGIVPPGKWGSMFFFREDYFQQATGDDESVNVVWLQTRDPQVGRRVASQVEHLFANAREEVKVETEAASTARVAGKASSIMAIVNLVVVVLIIDMLVILANSISISTRERRVEMAVLKVLGFSPNYIIAMVVAEAVLVGAALSGLVGAGIASSVSALNEAGRLPFVIGFLRMFPVPLDFVLRGVLLGALAGFLGSMIPALSARKVSVTEVFSKIA